MLKYNLGLLAGSGVLFAASIAAASFHYDGAPERNSDQQVTRKNGDMVVFYRGRSYRSMSARRGSTMNRTYVGGGLRGGK